MPENTPATDAAESPSSSTAARFPHKGKVLLGAAVATAVAVGLTAVRWSSGAEPVSAAPKTAATQQSAAAHNPLAASRPSPKKSTDRTDKAGDQAHEALRSWSESNPADNNDKNSVSGTPEAGAGGRLHEVLRIPALGTSWAQPIYEGVGARQLGAGVGHFDGSAEPGQIGNFAVAGHRSGVTSPPFHNINSIKPGSAINVTTSDRTTYTYTVSRVRIVAPTDVGVLLPVPDKPNAAPTSARLTLVTCWPANGHTKRVIVEADLTASRGGAT
ncbi:sortase [Streptomyces decoyicus]|uniref:sortase n=1 Tax=Streptomyces decoyicus TaxID=249567 RepID=UPI00365945AF